MWGACRAGSGEGGSPHSPADKVHNGPARGQARGSFRPCLLIRVSVENTHRGNGGSRRPQRPRDSTGPGTHLVALLQQELSQVGAVLEDKEEGQRQTRRSHDQGLRTAFQGLCGRKQGPQQPTRKTMQTTGDVSTVRCSAVLQAFPQAGAHLSPRGDKAGDDGITTHTGRDTEVQGHWGQRAGREASESGDLVQVWPLASRVKHTERVGLLKALVLLGHKAGR